MVGLYAGMARRKRQAPEGAERQTGPVGTEKPKPLAMPSADTATQLTRATKRAMNPAPTGLMRGSVRAAPERAVAAPGQRSVGGVRADRIPGVSGRLSGLLSENSPYLEQARSRARRTANRRGLMNSSIAAGAGEEAAIAAALPIAQADASIAAGERALESQEFQQARSIASTEGIAAESRALQDLMQTRQIGSAEMMQARDLRTRELMQERGLSHDAAQRQADRELSDLMQTRQIASTERVAKAQRELQDLINQRNIRSQELMQERGLSHDAAQRQAQREMQSSIAAAERQLQSSIAAANRQVQRETLESSKRIATMNAQSRNYGTYQQSVDRINANADLPAEERAEQLKQAQQAFDMSTTIVQQVTGTEFDWPTYQPASS